MSSGQPRNPIFILVLGTYCRVDEGYQPAHRFQFSATYFLAATNAFLASIIRLRAVTFGNRNTKALGKYRSLPRGGLNKLYLSGDRFAAASRHIREQDGSAEAF